MENEKSSLLLILSLALVFIVALGISFAYFSARIIGNESVSTMIAESGKMLIEYSENTNEITLEDIYPREEAWVTKTITLKGTNSTNLYMKYDLGLEVTTNDFRNSYIKYDLKLVEGNNGSPISDITLKNINGIGYKRFGIGYFVNADEEIHKYELKIYFKNNGKDQNDAQEARFNAKIVISDAGSFDPNKKRAMFLSGNDVNIKMKTLANLANNDETVPLSNTANTTITAIKESKTEPTLENKEEKNIVSINNDEYPIPIYMWYEEGIIYWWSKDKKPMLNPESNSLFFNFNELNNINGVSNFDTSNLLHATTMFANTSVSDLSSLVKWNTSRLNNSFRMFASCTNLQSLYGLDNWDTSKITLLASMFAGSSNITDFSALSNWDVSNVTNMNSAFSGIKLNTNVSYLSKWDVSKVTDMSHMFMGNDIKNLAGINEWDVSNVKSMTQLFRNNIHLENSAYINNWDISNVTNFDNMFYDCPTHPEFTIVQGTWNNGTFIPNS